MLFLWKIFPFSLKENTNFWQLQEFENDTKNQRWLEIFFYRNAQFFKSWFRIRNRQKWMRISNPWRRTLTWSNSSNSSSSSSWSTCGFCFSLIFFLSAKREDHRELLGQKRSCALLTRTKFWYWSHKSHYIYSLKMVNRGRFLESIRIKADRLNEQNNVAEEEYSSLTTLWSPRQFFCLTAYLFSLRWQWPTFHENRNSQLQ